MVSSQTDVRYREGYDSPDDYSNELHISPDLAPLDPLLDARPGRGRTRRASPSGKRRSVGKEILRLFVYGLIITAIGGAAFASQYGDDNIKETLGFLQNSVSGLSPVLGADPSARVPEGLSPSSDQVSTQDRSLKEARALQSPPTPVRAGSSPQIQQQLETMTTELAAVRGLAEQIAVSQKKMSQDIAALETTNLSQKTWWLYQSSAFDAPPQKSVKKIAPSPAKSSPGPAPVPTTRAQTP